jgi:hypothetical protein
MATEMSEIVIEEAENLMWNCRQITDLMMVRRFRVEDKET